MNARTALCLALVPLIFVGCGPKAARFEHVSQERFPPLDYEAVNFYEAPRAESSKIGEIHVVRSSHYGRNSARDSARYVVRRLAAENGASDVVIIKEDLDGRGRGWSTARITADAFRVP